MSDPDFIAVPSAPQDRLWVCAQYNDQGLMTSVDVIINNGDDCSTVEEIGQLIRLLARKGIPPTALTYTPS